jgi:WD40 repeat protein
MNINALAKIESHKGLVTSIAFSDDGKRIDSGLADSTVQVWDAVTSNVLAKLKGDGFPVTSVAFLNDGETIVSIVSRGSSHLRHTWTCSGAAPSTSRSARSRS